MQKIPLNYMQKQKLLAQFIALDGRINDLLEEKRMWYSRALSLSQHSGERVKCDRNTGKIDKAIEKVDAIEREITADIDRLCDMRKMLADEMSSLQDMTQKRLIELRYIHGIAFEGISRKLGYCPKQISRMHKKAVDTMDLSSLAEMFPELVVCNGNA